MDMQDSLERKRAILKFCEGLFETKNLTPTDFEDVNIMRVEKRDFAQQSDGAGLHVTFSVSWHAIGKTREKTHAALERLLSEVGD